MSRPSNDDAARGQLVQAHEAAPERRLAAARLADEAERLARAHLERRRRRRPARERPRGGCTPSALDREVLRHALAPRAAARRSRAPAPGESSRLAPRELLRHGQEAAVEVAGRARSSSVGPLGSRPGRRAGSAARTRSPAGSASSDGGRPGIAVRRCGLGRSMRGIEPSRPQVYGCCGVPEQLALRAVLDDAARVHHADAVGDVGDDAHVVRDQR